MSSQQQRRRLLKAASGALLAVPVFSSLPGCHKQPPTAGAANAVNSGPAWTRGGTARIGNAARFPDPFGALSNACELSCMATIGPCHTLSPQRSDVSDGWDGLPLRLALRVVDTDCKPVENALVEIWHTNYTGGYSGRINQMCNNNKNDLDKQFFRGYQRSDAHGLVHFDTCYPGWYSSRAVHIHLRVLVGDYDADDGATSSITTQLLFTDELNREIFTTHPLYAPHGVPDTLLAADNVVGGEADKRPYLFDVRRMDDGVMFASKTLVLRKNLQEPICEARGVRGPMPPGGPGGAGQPPPGAPPPANPAKPDSRT